VKKKCGWSLPKATGPSFLLFAALVVLGLLAGIWTRDDRWAVSACVLMAPTVGFGIAWLSTRVWS
jgi:hypothetical protein